MPDTVAKIVRLGKQLPREERERLADELLMSSNEPAASELDAAWAEEIERRLVAYDRGDVKSVAASDVFEKARTTAK